MRKLLSKLLILFCVTLISLVPTLALRSLAAEDTKNTVPTFTITKVVPDSSVTIKAYNFPSDETFNILMNKIGTKGVNGIVVDTISTGSSSTFSATISIPNSLKGKKQIAIRFQSTTGSGYYSYNWFYNKASAGGTGGPYKSGYSGHPLINVISVVKGKSVTIKMTNLPKNDEFKVLMNNVGTNGVNGKNVGSFSTGSAGTLTMKFKIPDTLKNKSKLAIRIQSTSGTGYFGYDWFTNLTTP